MRAEICEREQPSMMSEVSKRLHDLTRDQNARACHTCRTTGKAALAGACQVLCVKVT